MSTLQKVYQKYVITKTNGEPVDAEAKYFVLRIDQDDVWGLMSRRALNRMASDMRNQGVLPELANGISEYVFNNSPIFKKESLK